MIGSGQIGKIIAIVRDGNRKAKRSPFVSDRFQVQDVFGVTDALNTVQVHDHGQWRKLLLAGKQNRFPRRTFVAIAI
jgi:hypothetical protein